MGRAMRKRVFRLCGQQRPRLDWTASCENCVFGLCAERRPRSDCASLQSDLVLRCPLTESLDTTECINGEQRPRSYFAHAQDDLNLCISACSKARFRLTQPKTCFTLSDRVKRSVDLEHMHQTNSRQRE